MAHFEEGGAEPAHRPVLPGIVALGHDDRRSEAERGGGIGDALAVIASRRGDDARYVGPAAPQIVELDHAAAHLEGAGRGMVLVLDPDLVADPAPPERPAILR